MKRKNMDDQDIIVQIATIKEDLGEQLIILTHHYQRKEIVDIGHYRGDSLGLLCFAGSILWPKVRKSYPNHTKPFRSPI